MSGRNSTIKVMTPHPNAYHYRLNLTSCIDGLPSHLYLSLLRTALQHGKCSSLRSWEASLSTLANYLQSWVPTKLSRSAISSGMRGCAWSSSWCSEPQERREPGAHSVREVFPLAKVIVKPVFLILSQTHEWDREEDIEFGN